MKRCTGHCCKDFPLPYTIEEIKNKPNLQDGQQIAEMLIFLRESNYLDGKKSYRYTCKHLQKSGDCGIYESRPRMCSNYPYGKACENVNCTADQEELIQLTKGL